MTRPCLIQGAFQLAYVTNDLDHAMAMFQSHYGVGDFFVSRDVPDRERAEDDATFSMALGYAGRTNIELIEAKARSRPLYADWITGVDGFVARFHHIGILVEDAAGWRTMRDSFVAQGTAIAMEGEVPGAIGYLYADTRSELGHYLEYIRLFDDGRAMFEAVPGYPGDPGSLG